MAGESSKRVLSTSNAYLESLAAAMTDEQVAEAEQRASHWLTRHPQETESVEAQKCRDPRNGSAPPKVVFLEGSMR